MLDQNKYSNQEYGIKIKCVLKTCKNKMSENRSISYFKFPRNDPIKCAKWIENCGLLIPIDVVLSKYLRICGKHFADHMFINKKRNRLHPHAIPELYLDHQILPCNKIFKTESKKVKWLRPGIFSSENERKCASKITASKKIDYVCDRLSYKDKKKNFVKQKVPVVGALVPDTKEKKTPKTVIQNTMNMESRKLNVLWEHNYFDDLKKKKKKKKSSTKGKYLCSPEQSTDDSLRRSHTNSEYLCSSEQSMDNSLPEWCNINSEEEDEISDTEIISLSQLLRLEYEKDSQHSV